MKKKIILSLMIFVNSLVIRSQEKEKYSNYFKDYRESVFLHLNKATYNIGEEIWFKGYLYNHKEGLLSNKINNLYCNIYDSLGNILLKKMFVVKKGMTKGNIFLDKNFISGDYYLKAFTKRMLNSKNSQPYIQKIQIISKEKKIKVKVPKLYHLSVLPEGGHTIKGINNIVGIKVLNNLGFGVKIDKGVVLDENNKEVVNFDSNKYGLGKFEFTPLNSKYKINVIIKKDTISSNLVIKKEGIALSVDNEKKDEIVIKIKRSKKYDSFLKKKIKLLVHRDGKIKKREILSFNDEELEKNIKIKRIDLLKGINIITLFYNEEPIIERLFFNNLDIKNTNINIEKVSKEKDSTLFKIKVTNNYNVYLSNSIISKNTLNLYNLNNNIHSEIYLRPYIRGAIEDSYQYFDSKNKNKKTELDLLLLTQGWSRYDWGDIFTSNEINNEYKYEKGITILGRVPKIGKNQTLLYGKGNTLNKKIIIDNNRSFKLESIEVFEGEKLRFSLFDKKENIFSSPKVYLKYVTKSQDDKLKIDELINKFVDYSFKSDFTITTNNNSSLLDEVVINKTKRKKIEMDENKPYYASATTKKHNITQNVKRTFGTIQNFLRSLGFMVTETAMDGSLGLKVTTRETLTFNTNNQQTPTIYVDGTRIDENDLSYLFNMSLDEVDEIYHNRHGIGQGVTGTFGVVTINTKKKRNKVIPPKTFIDIQTEIGFSKSKKYYTPFNHLNENFETVVDWKPSIVINKRKGYAFMKISNKTKEVVFFIEGIDDSGNLFSKRIYVQN